VTLASWKIRDQDYSAHTFAWYRSLQFRLRNDLYCVEWGVKLYSLIHRSLHTHTRITVTRHIIRPPFVVTDISGRPSLGIANINIIVSNFYLQYSFSDIPDIYVFQTTKQFCVKAVPLNHSRYCVHHYARARVRAPLLTLAVAAGGNFMERLFCVTIARFCRSPEYWHKVTSALTFYLPSWLPTVNHCSCIHNNVIHVHVGDVIHNFVLKGECVNFRVNTIP